MSGVLKVKNWKRFQHYKHRSPPWIKLHRALLDDRDYHALEDGAQALLVAIWLLASESDNSVLADSAALAWRLRRPVEHIDKNLRALVAGGFLVLDGELASTLHQNADTEKSRVEKSRVETEKRQSSRASARATWLTPFGEAWETAYGGQPKYGKLANHLKPLVDAHGAEKVLAHWGEFLRATEAKYASASRFAETFGTWGGNGKSLGGPISYDECVQRLGKLRLSADNISPTGYDSEAGFQAIVAHKRAKANAP